MVVGVGAVGVEEMLQVGELGVDEGQLVDRCGNSETPYMGGEKLLVERVIGYLHLHLAVPVTGNRHQHICKSTSAITKVAHHT